MKNNTPSLERKLTHTPTPGLFTQAPKNPSIHREKQTVLVERKVKV